MAKGSETRKVKVRKVPTSFKKVLKILKDNPMGLRAASIISLSGLPSSTVYDQLTRLKQMDLVKNVFPIWSLSEIQGTPSKLGKLLTSDSRVQLHDLSFVVRLVRKPLWWDRRHNRLLRLKGVNSRRVGWGNAVYDQWLLDDYVVQLFSNSMIFACKKKYWGLDSYEVFLEGLRDFYRVMGFVESFFKFKFFMDGVPHVSVRSSHLVHLRDAVAEKCKREGKEFEVVLGSKRRLWVDLSLPFGLEAGDRDHAVEDMRVYEEFVADVVKNNPPTNSELAGFVRDLVEDRHYYAENIESHVKAIKSLGLAVEELSKRVKRL